MICAWAGETDLALEQLEAVTKVPGGPSYGELRLDPMWDPLARRSALRKNRRLLSAERNGFQITPGFLSVAQRQLALGVSIELAINPLANPDSANQENTCP